MFSNFKNVGCVSIEISRDSEWKNYSIILYIIQQISFQVCCTFHECVKSTRGQICEEIYADLAENSAQ